MGLGFTFPEKDSAFIVTITFFKFLLIGFRGTDDGSGQEGDGGELHPLIFSELLVAVALVFLFFFSKLRL
jgi:hypothetical protein